jgi:hypothetical protein
VIRGLNKPSVKKVRKNILPPFDDEGWVKYKTDVQDYVKDGYEVSYKTNETYGGLTYSVPLEYAGKVVSLSVQEMEGKTPRIMLSWRIGTNTWSHNTYQIMGVPAGSINGIKIPSNAEEIIVYVQETVVRGQYTRIKGVQLEEGVVATGFEEQLIQGGKALHELVPKKNLFDGLIEEGNINPATGINETGVNKRSVNFIPAKQNTTYTMSKETTSNWNPRIFYYDKDLTLVTTLLKGDTNTDIQFTTPPRTAYIRWHDYATPSGTKVQIEEGSRATTLEPYELVEKPIEGRLVPKKNVLKDIDSIQKSPLWLNELGVNVEKLTEKFNGQDVYRLTFPANKNSRIFQYISKIGNYSAGIWLKFEQYDSSLILTLREKNFGSVYGVYSFNNATTEWQYGKLENIKCANEFMFAIYKSAVTTSKDIVVKISMPQLEEGALATDFEPRKEVNKVANRVPKRNMLNPKAWLSGRIFDTAFKSQNGYRLNGDNLVIQSNTNGMVSQVVKVKPNTLYTVFHDSDNDGSRGIYVYSMSGTDLTPSVKISPNVFNSGNNDKVIIGMYKSTSANNLSEIEFVKPMMVEGAMKVAFEPFLFANESEKLVPKKNMLPPLKYWARTDGNAVILSDYEGEINPVSNYTGFKYSSSIGIKRDTLYTISIDEITPNAVCFIAYVDSTGTNRYTTVNSTSLSRTFSIPASAQSYWLEMHFQTNRGKCRFKNFMIYEGNATQKFEPMELIPEVKAKPVKASHKRYPFNFKRESVEVLDNVRYGYNAPRIKNEGVLIEEATTNLVPKVYDGFPAMRTTFVNGTETGYTMRLVYDGWDGAHLDTPTLSITPNADYTVSYKIRVVEGDDIKIQTHFSLGASSPIGDSTNYPPISVGKEWVEVVITKKSASTNTTMNRYVPYVFKEYVKGQLIEVKDWQLEQKSYNTSYTAPKSERKMDYVTTPKGVIDSAGGSLELTFIPTVDWKLQKANSQARYFVGTDMGDTQILRLWSWGGSEPHLGSDFKASDGTRQYSDKSIDLTTKFLVGKPTKMKMAWGDGFLRTYLDGEMITEKTGLKPFKDLSQNVIIIGGSSSSSDKCFMGIYKDFVIKDRNGLKTFSF